MSETGASPFTTSASFQHRLSASWMPPLPPRAPKGDTTCALSPTNTTRPARAFEPRAAERVDRTPFKLDGRLADDGFHAPHDALGFALPLGFGFGAKLEIDAEHIVSLAVHQRALAGMESRLEPEQALGRVVRLHPHIGDEETLFEPLSFERQRKHGAHRRARAVTGQKPSASSV